MPISLTLEAIDAADLKRQLAELLGAPTPNVIVGADATSSAQTETPKATRATKPKDEPAPQPTVTEEVKTEEVQEHVHEGLADDPTSDGPLTYDGDIKPAVLRVSAKHGRPGVEKLLADFEVTNAKEVPEARWPELMAAIDKLLEG